MNRFFKLYRIEEIESFMTTDLTQVHVCFFQFQNMLLHSFQNRYFLHEVF